MLHSINKEQRLYCIRTGNSNTKSGLSFSTYGFDVLFDKVIKLAKEQNRLDLIPKYKGTKKVYNNYLTLIKVVQDRNKFDGYQSRVDLSPQLLHLEGRRVEVVDKYDDTRRFYVGKSTGWIPCHLEIARRNSHGGGSVYGDPFKSIRVLY